MVLVFSITGDVATCTPSAAVTLNSNDCLKRWAPMSPQKMTELVNFLESRIKDKEKVVSYGGASFGLKSIRSLVTDPHKLDFIAKNHVDLLHLFVVDNGYRASLQSFLKDEEQTTEDSIVYSIHKIYTKAVNTGVLMRKARSKQIFPWFIRQELELPPINVPSVIDALQRPRTVPSWIKDPIAADDTLHWLADIA